MSAIKEGTAIHKSIDRHYRHTMEADLRQRRAAQERIDKALLEKQHDIEDRLRDEIANSGDC